MVRPHVDRLGELVITADEHAEIVKLIRPYPDGSLPPGYVTLIVDIKDRLTRYRDGVSLVLYEVPGGHEALCVAAIHTCTLRDVPGELTTASRVCYEGQDGEWWIVLPGARMMFITPDRKLDLKKEVVVTFEILPNRAPGIPEQLVPAGPVRDVRIHGAN